ncbi:MAG: hypothetical protein ACRETN_06465 [Nevskiales bacterium]
MRGLALLVALCALLLAAGCSDGGGGNRVQPGGSSGPTGTPLDAVLGPLAGLAGG